MANVGLTAAYPAAGVCIHCGGSFPVFWVATTLCDHRGGVEACAWKDLCNNAVVLFTVVVPVTAGGV